MTPSRSLRSPWLVAADPDPTKKPFDASAAKEAFLAGKSWQATHNVGLLAVLVPIAILVFFLRRLLNLRQRSPAWNWALRLIAVPAAIAFVVTAERHYVNKALGQWYLLLTLYVLSAMLLHLRHYRPARTMLLGLAPLLLRDSVRLGMTAAGYQLVQPYRGYFLSGLGWFGLTWIGTMLLVAFGQKRTLAKEALQQAEEEKARQLVATQNAELERLVARRTATLTQQAAELQGALTELRATQAQLIQSEKMASLGELTAGIAHEIQNPLNFVNNFADVSAELVAELAEEQARPTPDADLEAELLRDLKHNLHKINLHGQRASSIVRGMLAHSRASTGERQPTDLNALCDEYLRLAYHGLRAKDKSFNATLATDFAPRLPAVEVVPGDLGRVLLNLFTNAFYAVQKRQGQGEAGYAPTVQVNTRALPGAVEIRVRDNGTGIPAELLDKIFQPFFTTKPSGEGTGLGLSLAHDIVVKGHQGDLRATSQLGQGTEFTIQIPQG